MSFPTPVGGSALRSRDHVASIIFSAIHGLLVPTIIYRLVNKRSRTFLISSTLSVLIERTVVFSLRAAAAQTNADSDGISEYMQVSFALGYIYLLQDVASLLRSILVDSTKGTEYTSENVVLPELISTARNASWTDKPPSTAKAVAYFDPSKDPLEAPVIDRPRRRYWFRRMYDITQLLLIVCFVTGSWGNGALIRQRDNPTQARANQALRYTCASVALCLSLWMTAVAVWSRKAIPHINRRATTYIITFALLLSIPGIYRIAVMWNTTHDWPTYAGPGSLNSPGAKAAFYAVHFVPEWLTCAIVCASNIREIFGCGMYGDRLSRDETAEEKMKREQKEKERKIKKDKRRARARLFCKTYW